MQSRPRSDVGGEPQDYWSTMGGIGVRIEMFGEQLEWGTWNNSVRIVASSVGVFDMKMIGETGLTAKGNPMCDWCGEHIGRVYRSNRGFFQSHTKHFQHLFSYESVARRG